MPAKFRRCNCYLILLALMFGIGEMYVSAVILSEPATITEPAASLLARLESSSCDVNGDGFINVSDVQLAVNCVLNASNCADINNDGVTNISDIQLLVNIILNIISCPERPTTTTTSTTQPPTTTTTTSTTSTTTTTTTLPTTTTTTLPTIVARGVLDVPAPGQTITGTINGSGWAFIQVGNTGVLPSRIDIVVDNVVVAQGASGSTRADVPAAFPGIVVPPNTGFTFSWNSATVAAGTHTLIVRIADAAGAREEATYEIARITIVVAAPPSLCAIFGDNFDSGSAADWSVATGSWQVSSGWLWGSWNSSSGLASVYHALPTPNHLFATVDIHPNSVNNYFYGILPFSFNQLWNFRGIRVSGIGATVTSNGQIGFLMYDYDRSQFIIVDNRNYGPVRSIGVRWAGSGVSLWINGNMENVINPLELNIFGSLPAPSLSRLFLWVSGAGSQVGFDNVCVQSVNPTIVSETGEWPPVLSPGALKRSNETLPGLDALPLRKIEVLQLHDLPRFEPQNP